MAKMIPMDERWEWENEQEFSNAQILQPSNLQFIKTQLSLERRRLANLQPDPENYTKFVQEHAAIAGAVSAYLFLINSHEDVIRRLAVD